MHEFDDDEQSHELPLLLPQPQSLILFPLLELQLLQLFPLFPLLELQLFPLLHPQLEPLELLEHLRGIGSGSASARASGSAFGFGKANEAA